MRNDPQPPSRNGTRLVLGPASSFVIEFVPEALWRLGVECRDDDYLPWADGAWCYVTAETALIIADRIREVVSRESPRIYSEGG